MTTENNKTLLENDLSFRGATFLPIIKFCLENGCQFKDTNASQEKPYTGDKSGVETCTLIGPITVKAILERYKLPKNITYSENGFWDSNDTVGLSFITSEKFERVQTEIKNIRTKSDARIAAIRAKRNARK